MIWPQRCQKNLTYCNPSSMIFNEFWQIRIKDTRFKSRNTEWSLLGQSRCFGFNRNKWNWSLLQIGIPGNTKTPYKAMGILISIPIERNRWLKISIPIGLQQAQFSRGVCQWIVCRAPSEWYQFGVKCIDVPKLSIGFQWLKYWSFVFFFKGLWEGA